MRQAKRGEHGVASLELALVLPLLLAVLFGLMEVAWLASARLALEHAVAEGARHGAEARPWLGEEPEAFARRAVAESFWLFDVPPDVTEVRVLAAEADAPRRLAVTVAALPYSPLVGALPHSWLPDALTARAVTPLP